MSDDELRISVSLPLDDDGFLPRSCPTCERPFKWLHTEPGEGGTEPLASGFFCPYCRRQAASDQWFTLEQVVAIEQATYDEVVEPFTERLQASVDEINRSGGGLFSARLDIEREAERPVEPAEATAMRQAAFACHPGEPLKVLSEVPRTHCLICGAPETTTSEAAG